MTRYPTPHPELEPGVVQVWRASLTDLVLDSTLSVEILSDEERARSRRFLRADLATRYVAVRALLRRLLGAHRRCSAAAVELDYGAHGKPRLPGGPHFNLSHSSDRVVLAFSSDGELGIDIERRVALPDLEAVAKTAFSPSEQALLAGLDPEDRVEGFYRCWTSKEAFIKYTGEGLYRDLDSFDVAFGPNQELRIVRAAGIESIPVLHPIADPDDYTVMLAVGAPVRVRVFEL